MSDADVSVAVSLVLITSAVGATLEALEPRREGWADHTLELAEEVEEEIDMRGAAREEAMGEGGRVMFGESDILMVEIGDAGGCRGQLMVRKKRGI